MFSRKAAKSQRDVVAALREISAIKKLIHLPVVILKLNRISIVQECDARMLKKEQMPETKALIPERGAFYKTRIFNPPSGDGGKS
jgi:hypothetical protein